MSAAAAIILTLLAFVASTGEAGRRLAGNYVSDVVTASTSEDVFSATAVNAGAEMLMASRPPFSGR